MKIDIAMDAFSSTLRRIFTDEISSFLSCTAILVAATLVSVQMRLTLPYGSTLYPGYQPLPFQLYVLLLVGAGLAFLVGTTAARHRGWIRTHFEFVVTLLGLGLSFLGIAFLLPDISLLQMAYYIGFGIAIDVIAVLWPGQALSRHPRPPVGRSLSLLWQRRTLLRLWVINNIRARYAQTMLGVVWIVLLPLSYSLILSFVFSQIVRIPVGDVPYISFFLAALTPWSLFQQGALNGTGSVVSFMTLVNQIYFPREVLVLVKLGELLVDFTFQFVALLLVNAVMGVWPNIYFVYLPLLMFIVICLTLGVMFFVAYLTVFIRDIPQLVFVTFQLLFYLTPIIYPLDLLPARFRAIALINPLVPVIQAYRDIIVYGHPPDLLSLCYPLVVAVIAVYLGYNFFKASEGRMTDFL